METFFDFSKDFLISLPDRAYVKETDQWYYIFKPDRDGIKEKIAQMGLKIDKDLYQKTKMYYCPTEKRGAQAVIIVDSWPSLLSQDQDQEDKERSKSMAYNARKFSEYLPQIVGKLRRKSVILLGINQIRTNPMAYGGCLHADTSVAFVDGRSMSIKQIVEGRVKGKVWSFNESSNSFEAKAITGWHDNGVVEYPEDWITIKSQGIDTPGGICSVTVTPDHKLFTKRGWVRAESVTESDKLLTTYSKIPHASESFLYAVITADASMIPDKRSLNTCLALRNNKQPDYNAWKLSKLKGLFEFKPAYPIRKAGIKGSLITVTKPYYELSVLNNKMEGRRNPLAFAKHFTKMSLAMHYMDDGNFDTRPDVLNARPRASISYRRFAGNAKVLEGIQAIYSSFGYVTTIGYDMGCIKFGPDHLYEFLKDIACYVHPSMSYKLPLSLQGKFVDFEVGGDSILGKVWVPVVSMNRGSLRKFRSKHKYDITVQDNHNYMSGSKINGVIVHNSGNYEPGGAALKFYSGTRCQLFAKTVPHDVKKQTEEEPSVWSKGTDVYAYKYIKNTKQKFGTPYLDCSTRVWVRDSNGQGRGYCYVWDQYQYYLLTGRIEGKRNKFKITGVNGIPASKTWVWLDFKKYVLAEGKEQRGVAAQMINSNKYVDMRKLAFAELKDGSGMKLFHKAAANKSKSSVEDLEE
jgi:hypothetical protein